uniref:Uncharacterized protein n=1 Tax=Psilocybe cubensis TaxID=181762 RepID=A0A8H8CG51_PSICU
MVGFSPIDTSEEAPNIFFEDLAASACPLTRHQRGWFTSSLSLNPTSMPTIRRRVIRRSNAMRVTNHDRDRRDSGGLESLSSSVAPPCYTSQRGPGSSVAASDEAPPSIAPSEDNDSVSMHSCPEISNQEILPSPYSTEDLFADMHRMDDDPGAGPVVTPSIQTHSCTHGYTHTHSQCTFDNPPPPATADSHLDHAHSIAPTTSSPFPASESSSSPYPFENQRRTTRRSSTPSTPYATQRGRASDVSSPSPRPILYHHRHMSQPAAIGHLTQRSLKAGYELHLDPDDILASENDPNNSNNNTPPVHTPLANSTITFLQDDPYASPSPANHRSGRATPHAHRRAYSALSTSHLPASASASTAYLPTNQRATNYVSLSRKSTASKGSFFAFGRKPTHSSITGTFTIDPGLRVPVALLKAVEPRALARALSTAAAGGKGVKSDAMSASLRKPVSSNKTHPQSSSNTTDVADNGPKPGVRRKNLVLEVENGGIDVDVHLVPEMAASTDGFSRRRSVDARAHVQEGSGFVRRPRSSTRRTLVEGEVNDLPPPTLIDLRLKDVSGSRRSRSKEFPLIARIHAPIPRPPFHLFASTINITPDDDADVDSVPALDVGNINSDKLVQEARLSASLSPPLASSTPTNTPSVPVPAPTKPTTVLRKLPTLARSNLTLHLPTSFRGPLTVHVAAGNIDEHVRVSRGVSAAAVVLAESAGMRGFYVGGEGEGVVMSGGGVVVGDQSAISYRRVVDADPGDNDAAGYANLVPSGTDDQGEEGEEEGDGEVDNEEEEDDENAEWLGDKVDVVVGDGKVYLQFVGEEDPFGHRRGFWRTLLLGGMSR